MTMSNSCSSQNCPKTKKNRNYNEKTDSKKNKEWEIIELREQTCVVLRVTPLFLSGDKTNSIFCESFEFKKIQKQ